MSSFPEERRSVPFKSRLVALRLIEILLKE
jgi:hypothetical protein